MNPANWGKNDIRLYNFEWVGSICYSTLNRYAACKDLVRLVLKLSCRLLPWLSLEGNLALPPPCLCHFSWPDTVQRHRRRAVPKHVAAPVVHLLSLAADRCDSGNCLPLSLRRRRTGSTWQVAFLETKETLKHAVAHKKKNQVIRLKQRWASE